MNQELERAILFHLQSAWRLQNYQIFDDQLKAPIIQLSDHESALGQWDGRRRVISIQRAFVQRVSWLEVIEVLKHEMAHQFVQEVLKRVEPSHGPIFREVCRARGIRGGASATIQDDPVAERLLRRINKLLALAQSDNAHEAERAAERAQALLLEHHISLGRDEEAGAQLNSSRDELSDLDTLNVCQLGPVRARRYQYEYALLNLLSEHFFISILSTSGFCVKTGKPGRAIEACGRPEDLEIASYVHDFVNNHLDLAWRAHRAQTRAKGLRARLSFSLGLVSGFREKLTRAQQERDASQGDQSKQSKQSKQGNQNSQEHALMMISKSRAARLTALRYSHVSRGSNNDWSPSREYHEGFTQGRALNLNRGVKDERASSGAPHRLTYDG